MSGLLDRVKLDDLAMIEVEGVNRHTLNALEDFIQTEADRLGLEVEGFGYASRTLTAFVYFTDQGAEVALTIVHKIVDKLCVRAAYIAPDGKRQTFAPMPKQLVEVRRTNTTLTLISKQNGDTVEMTCGVHGHYVNGSTLVNIGNSLDSEPGGLIALTLKDEQGIHYGYAVWTDDLNKFLPMLQKPRKYPVLTAIEYAEDFINLNFVTVAGQPQQITLGVRPDLFRYTIKSYATNWPAAHLFDAPYLSFYFTDEAGKTWESTFTASVEEIEGFCNQLHIYIKALNSPKYEAAATSYTLQQAA
jgi:hypothetical protein